MRSIVHHPLGDDGHEYMLWQGRPAPSAVLSAVIEKALERRKLHNQKTILFVKDVLETLNWA